ncbi:MAG: T9SS type A sorting domain-containing protein [Bacteroidetes bacterium]|nr:T9SS type A sorting domain-containing protein [Bacteroidota bacterium]
MKNFTKFLLFFFLSGLSFMTVAQNFNFTLDDDSVVVGKPGDILYGFGTITNNTGADIQIDIIRIENNLASGWLTAMCLDVCLPPGVDSTQLYLEAGKTQSYTMYFFTDSNESTSDVLILFRNVANSANSFTQRFYAESDNNFSHVASIPVKQPTVGIYPNPFTSFAIIEFDSYLLFQYDRLSLTLYNIIGKEVKRYDDLKENQVKITREFLPDGKYIYALRSESGMIKTGKFSIN